MGKDISSINEFDRMRMMGAQALKFSGEWFSKPVLTATRYAEWMMQTHLGTNVEALGDAWVNSIYANALLTGRWAACGFPTVTLGHRTAAAFAATRMKPDDAQEFVRAPWPAFGIRLPTELLWIEDNDKVLQPATFLIVGTLASEEVPGNTSPPGTERWWFKLLAASPMSIARAHELHPELRSYAMGFFDGVCLWGFNVEAKHLAAKDPRLIESDFKVWNTLDSTDVDQRSDELARALIIGACMYLSGDPRERQTRQAEDGISVRERKSKVRPGDTLPPYTEYEVTSSIRINLHHAMRDYVTRGGSSPSVQTLVGGHWKRVVYGQGRQHRRMQHIAPYWRGDINAPISQRVR